MAFLLAVASFARADSDRLRVGLEPFPPLILENGTGYSIDWLRALAKQAGMTLEVEIMPYSRAKVALMGGKVDLIGHTPYGLETDEFYRYAVELDARVPTKMDAFSLSVTGLNPTPDNGILIGAPFGNSAFISELTGIDRARFVEGSLPRLVSMMQAGRIDTVIFERMSVVGQIRKRAGPPVFYRLVKEIDAGFAVNRSRPTLLRRLNGAAARVDRKVIYGPYTNLLDWPDEGRVGDAPSGEPLP